MPLTLDEINTAPLADAPRLLDGIYEHSPWVAEEAMTQRPFATLAQLKWALVQAVQEAGVEAQLALIRAHPELAGKAMVSRTLTAESTQEQNKAGLTDCTPDEFARIQQLNADYNARFGFPFILAVRGPRGTGLAKQQIIDTFGRRLANHPDFERAEALRNIHRIAEIRLNEKFGQEPSLGNEVWDWHERLARHSDPGHAEKGQLTVTYLTDAHRACAQRISHWMRESGFDEVQIDAVGNVVGRYHPAQAGRADSASAAAAEEAAERKEGDAANDATGAAPARYLLTGSHYDTVRNGGKYDGRLGIFVPMACVQELHRAGKRLPFGIEVVAFAEEEGQRYKATFLGSGALVGAFDPAWLDQEDAEGITMRKAMEDAGLCIADIPKLKRDPADYLGYVEVHIEQGPVLNEMGLPLAVVTSINASSRYRCSILGMASHAGTTPMKRRRDAAAAAAELLVYMEQRATQDGDSVATMGMLQVPDGSVNVVPGRCEFSLDLRAPSDTQRDALVADVLQKLNEICQRRGLQYVAERSMQASCAPSDAALQAHWEAAVAKLGLPVHRMPSGAGHDAMKIHQILPQAMLFVRGENNGISHNPLESTTADDMQLAVQAFSEVLQQLAQEHP
ncbi:2-oxo-4-hydroxy-4-carboxy-5-ureidoimidazoline decarboxylase [Comamonas sp. NLF-1-9]|uniref:2-oxo-4-hydroxy-4-carboxy-5-ureidoimidazoline decarboxylase n=1 Tax=Comamonas sp. NLF-1-9 TaxID=2853163 RepID=UPI001C4631EA|nr:2-oxo-4-hydroxy-4-carboxy-5-ureidoimidazoline decarboxylase [Comamonas sp. NLF-1-9]QXL85645.1 2-oxo-4-hydroxy-4-carboxy-5-ureidoimidazoline decarboxylase [Comamonas sp. NLF-1-9]